MKTTLELPDELMRRIKLRAVHRNRKLKDEIAQLLEAGLAQAPPPEPRRKPPKPVKLRGGRLTTADIEAAIGSGRS
ncbi:MAG: hypothetical protein R3357_05950 [Burkholderiales bacterium]|nr:hypothetical protein [Burkholderiales bacterium]